MIKLITLFLLLFAHSAIHAQDQLKTVYVNEHVSTHFICSQPVQYVDISTDNAVGDIPLSNVVRLKPTNVSGEALGIITIVAQQYLVQYRLEYATVDKADKQIFIDQQEGRGLMVPEIPLSYDEMQSFALQALLRKEKKPKERNRRYGIDLRLNQVYTIGDYYLVDLTIRNRSKIQYDIDLIRFRIEDKKITKATNIQSVEILPEYQLHKDTNFKKKYRNVFVFRKFTYPNQKVFTIELAEKQISGRNIELMVDYKEVLDADIL